MVVVFEVISDKASGMGIVSGELSCVASLYRFEVVGHLGQEFEVVGSGTAVVESGVKMDGVQKQGWCGTQG